MGAKTVEALKRETKGRRNDPAATKANILQVATEEFAEHGLFGARIDEIAARTRTSKRMIYYYFTSKEELYRRVLEECYRHVRAGEGELTLEDRSPLEAMRSLVEFTFDHHRANPEFVRLVMIENIHRAEHLKESEVIRTANRGVIEKIRAIYEAGVETGDFRPGLQPIQIHWFISALAIFNVANRATFSAVFDWPKDGPTAQRALRDEVVEAVIRYVRT